MGLELIMESLSLHDQIYGIIHPEVARMYLAISNVYFSLDDKAMAFDLARKSVIIAERTLGLDASETVLAYLNLGLFEHARGNSAVALRYVLHALELSKTAYGADHPEAITMVTNGAVMLQSLHRYHESRVWFEAAMRHSDAATQAGSGQAAAATASTATAQLLFQLAQALALDRDHHGAVRRMRESCAMFRVQLGPDDRNTREAESWLESLTQNAVSLARRQKDLESGKLRRLNLFGGANGVAGPSGARKTAAAVGAGAPAAAAAGAAAAAAAGVGVARGEHAVDRRNIDDLIKYIDGDDSKKKKKRSHTRRRGAAAMVGA
jgi:protein TIF31